MFCFSQLLLFMAVGEGDSFTKMETKENVLLFSDLPWQHHREEQWQVENSLCVWQPLLESAGGGLVEGAPHPQHQDKQGHMVLLGKGQSPVGRKGLMESCLLLCALRAFSQQHRLVESSKNLKEPQVELPKRLVSPSLPQGVDSQTEREPQQIILTLATLCIPHTKRKNPLKSSEVW